VPGRNYELSQRWPSRRAADGVRNWRKADDGPQKVNELMSKNVDELKGRNAVLGQSRIAKDYPQASDSWLETHLKIKLLS
jgi:hypothetical protein